MRRAARVRDHQRREHPQQRRLAGAVRAEQSGDLAVGGGERDAVDRAHFAAPAERLGQVLDDDHERAPSRSGHSGGRALFSKCSTHDGRQRRERRIVDERRDEPRPAGVRRHDVAVAARDDVAACRQRLRDLGAVRGRRDRIEAAGQDQHRHVARDRRRRVGRRRALRPDGADGERALGERLRAQRRRASRAASAGDTRGTSSAQVTE